MPKLQVRHTADAATGSHLSIHLQDAVVKVQPALEDAELKGFRMMSSYNTDKLIPRRKSSPQYGDTRRLSAKLEVG